MSYENAIATYREIYQPVAAEVLAERWTGASGRLHVYVHSPFCASICKFCYYKGVLFDPRADDALYQRYYGEYLPRVIAPFRSFLETRVAGNYFFGGGTPSLMRPETLRSVFGLFPRFGEVASKTFEIHPALWSEAQLDVLAGSGFNCCIIGIQSFDERVLARQGRLHASFERVVDLAGQIRRRGMSVAVDLIYRMDEIDADQIFRADLQQGARLDPDVMSLQLNYDRVADDACNERFFELISDAALDARYYWEGGERIDHELKKTLKCFRYVRKGIPYPTYAEQIFPFIRTIDEGSKVLRPGYPSVIGFGSYRNPRKNTFSNLRSEDGTLEYIEVNNAWTPEYFITYDGTQRDFFQECQRELERFRSIGPPPRGVRISFENTIPRAKENYVFRRVDGQVGVGVVWDYVNPEIEEYLSKLRQVFPHWSWQDR